MVRKLVAVAASTLISACSPLQQAPLVYTSKQVLGIDFSTPSSESPSVAFSVGFKNLDAAYIPVAVSKKTGVDGQPDTREILKIYSTHGQGGAKGNTSPEEVAIKQKMQESLDNAIREKNEAQAKLEEFKKNTENYTKNISQNLDPSQPAEALLKNFKLPVTFQNQLLKREVLKPELVEKKEVALNKEVEQKTSKVVEIYDQFFDDMKTDSLSVFGTFDSKFTAQGANPTQGFGKVFSTGVASQNLTAGFRNSSVIEHCTEMLKLATAEQKQQVLDLCKLQLSGTPAK